jgi:uncharacterized membrane protein
LLVGRPIAGFVVGASAGAITGALRDSDLDDKLVRGINASLRPNTSAGFLLVHDADFALIADEMHPVRAQLRCTTLSPEQERQHHDVLAHETSAIPHTHTVDTPAGGSA